MDLRLFYFDVTVWSQVFLHLQFKMLHLVSSWTLFANSFLVPMLFETPKPNMGFDYLLQLVIAENFHYISGSSLALVHAECLI